MDFIYVDSSNIEAVAYDQDSATLQIKFKKGGSTYEYYDVPQFVYDELLAADSKGAYANANIYKVYRQQKIS